MSTRKWCVLLTAIVGAALAAGGCQTSEREIAKAPAQNVSRLPADMADMPEAPAPEILPDTHVAAGRLHESQGRFARAAEQYRLAVGAKPNHEEAYNRLGVVLDRMGKFREADEAFQRAIQLAPRKAHLHNNLAFSYIMQGRWAEAQASLTKALDLQPEFSRARVNLGMVMAQQGQFAEAHEAFGRVLRPEDAYYNLGLMYQSKQRPIEAAQAFRQALEANPKMVAAQKRLEMLPPDVIGEAQKRGELFAAATPPAAGPASELSNAEPPVEPLLSAGEVFENVSATTQPAEAALPLEEDLLGERMDADEWLFSSLGNLPAMEESTSDSLQVGTAQARDWPTPAELLSAAFEPVHAFLNSLPVAETFSEQVTASPLPPEVPLPDAEDSAVVDLAVPSSTAPAQ